ncbi:MAG TPA: ribulose phosphate epimerase [Dehalococcoidia bacterium]|jgi:peptidoglycan/xylan/chitin deacetylase (PgdA/CDA1 family)|nr:ribulose phosphate epimerase [Dehalococcoidia bacterium]|tara:strand:+ start:5357 stop:6208 length:852 start_codon:yes stop_codon:yes gene_type:complete
MPINNKPCSSSNWPEDIQCVAMITFDVDGVSSWINRDPNHQNLPSLMSMADYGPKVATPRILDILDTFNIKASFYIPGFIAETNSELVKDIYARKHEIGHHGYMHEPPYTLTPKEEHNILHKGINIIENLTGQKPKGYRSPSWELSKHSIDFLSEHDFVYDSSLMGDDKPYYVSTSDNKNQLVEIPVHWVLDDAPNFVFAPSANRMGPLKTGDEVLQSWKREFRGIYEYGGCFNLTMHPQYIGSPGRLLILKELLGYINTFDNVRFLTGIEVAEVFKKHELRG